MATRYGTHQFSNSHFEEKLSHLKDTQESIQELSAWCLLAHEFAFPQIINCWLNAIFKAKVDQCLTLFHLANDLIQRSKKKGWTDIVSAWEPALLKATPFVREDNVRQRVQRIFKIWDERKVYPSAFIAKLNKLLDPSTEDKEAPPLPAVKVAAGFKTAKLIEKIWQCQNLREDTNRRQRLLNESKLKITDLDKIGANALKKRLKTDDVFNELNDSITRMEDYVKSLETETRERKSLIALLQQGDLFYETQRGDFEVVSLVYEQFGSRVEGVKRKLNEILPNDPPKKSIKRERCISPPLPNYADALSPGSLKGSDLELPDAFNQPKGTGTNRILSLASPGMDLDSRITSFLAAGSYPELGSFLASPEAKKNCPPAPAPPPPPPPPTPPPPTPTPPPPPPPPLPPPPLPPQPLPSFLYAAPFYPANSPFGDLTSLLLAPPPPPPPPPRVSEELPKPVHPPLPPETFLGHNPARNGSANSFHSSGYNDFASEDVDLRMNMMPLDHRNISLVGGQTNSVPGVDEMQISNWLQDVGTNSSAEKADFNETVNTLLDSFSFTEPPQQQPHIRSLMEPNFFANAGYHQSFQQQHGPLMMGNVPDLMFPELYPAQRPPYCHLRGAVGPPNYNDPFNSPAIRFQNSPAHHHQRFFRPHYPRW